MNALLMKPARKAGAPTIPVLMRGALAPRAPHALRSAAKTLSELHRPEIADRFCNEPAGNFRALMMEVAACRSELAKIELWARKQLAEEAAYFRAELAKIEEELEAFGA